jgi:hypothetical protein
MGLQLPLVRGFLPGTGSKPGQQGFLFAVVMVVGGMDSAWGLPRSQIGMGGAKDEAEAFQIAQIVRPGV